MRILVICFALVSATLSATINKPFTVTVVFDNLTNVTEHKGTFKVIETGYIKEVSDLKSFTFSVPKNGNYSFKFMSTTAHAYIYHSKKLTRKNSVIRVCLVDYNLESCDHGQSAFPLVQYTYMDDNKIKKNIKQGMLNFIVHGIIDNVNQQNILDFKKKYGIGFVTKNCVVDPYRFKITRDRNTQIADFLRRTYGEIWKEDLTITPFGL